MRKKREVRLDGARPTSNSGNAVQTESVDAAINRCLESLIEDHDSDGSLLLLDILNGEISQKEAAHQLKIPYSTLKSRVQRARHEILNRFLEECCRLIYNRRGEVISCAPVSPEASGHC